MVELVSYQIEILLRHVDVGVCELQLGVSLRCTLVRVNGLIFDLRALHLDLPCVFISSLQKLKFVDVFSVNAFFVVTTKLDVRGFTLFHFEINGENHVVNLSVVFELVHEVSFWAESIGKVWSESNKPINLWII